MSSCSRLILIACVALALVRPASAQSLSKWYLAEGATGTFFEEQILIANPNATAAEVTITFLRPGGGTPVTSTFTMPATSRKTVTVNTVPGVENAPELSAVVECTNNLPIVVERSLYWPAATKRGGHNSQGVLAPATKWYLAEGSTGMFDDFVLIANPSTTTTASVQVTFLTPEGTTVVFPPLAIAPNARATVWPNSEVPALANKAFSTVVESTNAVPVFVERALYFAAGTTWEAGHGSTGITAPSPTWIFGEGFTGGPPSFMFDTFILLANPGTTATTATVTFLRENAAPIVKVYPIAPTSRENIWVDQIDGLEDAAFSVKIAATSPIIAERAMYWGPNGAWVEAHNSPGVVAEALKWGFAEGAEDGLDASGLQFDSYFLVANSSTNALELKATFMREDGTGIVRTFTVPGQSRFTLPTSQYPELSNQRFATFLESTNGVTFVAERTVYWGEGYFGGHGSTGTPFTGTVGTPGTPPAATITAVTPTAGSTLGGTDITITGTNFAAGATVHLGTTPATHVVVLNATTILATTPPSAAVGAVAVSVTSHVTTVALPAAFTYSYAPPVVSSVTPSTGPTTGGTQLTVDGANFVGVSVQLGSKTPTSITVQSPSRMLITTPTNTAGPVTLRVTNFEGLVGEKANAFTYQAATAADRILAFGDSLTEGYISTDCAFIGMSLGCLGDDDPAGGYPGRLQGLLRAQYPAQPTIAVANGGVGGETTGSGRTRLPSALAANHDLVVIMEGVNDTNAGVSSGTIISNLRSMVTSAKGAGKLVMLGTLLPCITVYYDQGPLGMQPYTKCDNAVINSVNTSIRALAAEQQVLLADFHYGFTYNGTQAGWFSGDGLHLSEAGYQRMAELVRNLMVANYETIPPPVP